MKSLAARGAIRARLGASMVEYAMMLALLSIVLIAMLATFVQSLKTSFGRTNSAIADVNTQASAPAP
jgi:Flp pilus assembly pilin Flp